MYQTRDELYIIKSRPIFWFIHNACYQQKRVASLRDAKDVYLRPNQNCRCCGEPEYDLVVKVKERDIVINEALTREDASNETRKIKSWIKKMYHADIDVKVDTTIPSNERRNLSIEPKNNRTPLLNPVISVEPEIKNDDELRQFAETNIKNRHPEQWKKITEACQSYNKEMLVEYQMLKDNVLINEENVIELLVNKANILLKECIQ